MKESGRDNMEEEILVPWMWAKHIGMNVERVFSNSKMVTRNHTST